MAHFDAEMWLLGYLPPSERNVVLEILDFTLYIGHVCNACKTALEAQGHRIHLRYGVQRLYEDEEGNARWFPDPTEVFVGVFVRRWHS